MWYLILLYIIPGMINTWLLPWFIEEAGGIEALNVNWDVEKHGEITVEKATIIVSVIPVFNIFSAFLLIYWAICTLRS